MTVYRYGFQLSWSDEDNAFVATCPDFPDLSAFGQTPAEALADAQKVLKMFIDEFESDGAELPPPTVLRPYSGQLRLRMPASIHARLSERADREGVSLNSLINVLIAEGLPMHRLEEQVQRVEATCREIRSVATVLAEASSSS